MTKLYRAYGKQVKRDGEHFADACSETAAQIISDALNGERVSPGPGMLCHAPEYKVNDAASVAELIEDVKKDMNSIGRHFPSGGLLIPPKEPIAILGANGPEAVIPLHNVVPRPDGGYNCSCGRGWDRDEGDDCPGATS